MVLILAYLTYQISRIRCHKWIPTLWQSHHETCIISIWHAQHQCSILRSYLCLLMSLSVSLLIPFKSTENQLFLTKMVTRQNSAIQPTEVCIQSSLKILKRHNLKIKKSLKGPIPKSNQLLIRTPSKPSILPKNRMQNYAYRLKMHSRLICTYLSLKTLCFSMRFTMLQSVNFPSMLSILKNKSKLNVQPSGLM